MKHMEWTFWKYPDHILISLWITISASAFEHVDAKIK